MNSQWFLNVLDLHWTCVSPKKGKSTICLHALFTFYQQNSLRLNQPQWNVTPRFVDKYLSSVSRMHTVPLETLSYTENHSNSTKLVEKMSHPMWREHSRLDYFKWWCSAVNVICYLGQLIIFSELWPFAFPTNVTVITVSVVSSSSVSVRWPSPWDFNHGTHPAVVIR